MASYWLAKTEPSVYSIDDLKRDRATLWDGVRNYLARNRLREMKPGDIVLIYHSSENPVGIAGLARVKQEAKADPTQFDPQDDHFDPKSSRENPRWLAPKFEFLSRFDRVFTLDRIRTIKGLKEMELLKRGSRLSVQPVSAGQFNVLKKTIGWS